MAPRHAFLFDKPVRFVLGSGAIAGAIWASTIGTAPVLVSANEHPYENPHGETVTDFEIRLQRQGTSKVQRHVTKDG
ncbi:MAG: hypothetical protein SGPRY_006768, partial [Prymnesium sp.]